MEYRVKCSRKYTKARFVLQGHFVFPLHRSLKECVACANVPATTVRLQLLRYEFTHNTLYDGKKPLKWFVDDRRLLAHDLRACVKIDLRITIWNFRRKFLIYKQDVIFPYLIMRVSMNMKQLGLLRRPSVYN